MSVPGSFVTIACLSMLGCGSSSSDDVERGEPTNRAATSDSSGSDETIGGFGVQLVAPVPRSDSAPASAGLTRILGKVYAAATPDAVIWEQQQEQDGCHLLVPRVPFCDPACGSGVCVEDDVCRDNPAARNLGTVTVKGLRSDTGGSEFSLISVQNAYQSPGDVKLAYPPCEEGEPIRIETSGADIAAFSLSGRGIAPLELPQSTGYELDASKPLALSWPAPGMPELSRIRIKLDISHHGGTKGKIECDVEDTGAFVISSALIARLLSLGVAGFPTIVLTRSAVSETGTASGRVALDIYSYQERAVEIPGLVSCVKAMDCPGGRECRSDQTCAPM